MVKLAVSCRCGWYREADAAGSTELAEGRDALSAAALRHEAQNIRRPLSHETTEVKAVA